MNRAEIADFLRDILRSKCQITVSEISEDLDLQKDLQLESIAILTLSVEIENQLKIILPDDPESPPQTVKEIIDLVEQGLSERDQS